MVCRICGEGSATSVEDPPRKHSWWVRQAWAKLESEGFRGELYFTILRLGTRSGCLLADLQDLSGHAYIIGIYCLGADDKPCFEVRRPAL